MNRKLIILVGLIALLFVATPVLAGGWVVITLDSLPEGIQAGEPLEISFMIRQHGKTPTHDVSPILMAKNTTTGEKFQVAAEKAKEIGRFTVTVNFPSAGAWEWSISAEPFPQITTLAPITVLAPEMPVASEKQAAPEMLAAPEKTIAQENSAPDPSLPWQLILRWSGLALLAAGLALIILDRRPRQKTTSPVSSDWLGDIHD